MNCPVDQRELGARRARSLAFLFVGVAELLESTDSLDPNTLRRVLSAIERVHLAVAGLERAKGGARREWVVSVLSALGALLEHFDCEEAWTTWLGLQSAQVEPDGPFLDLTAALVDERNQPAAIEAARALNADGTRGRKRADNAGTTAYDALNALFARLPDGEGGTLEVSSAPALRKLVSRARRKL